MRPSVSPDTPRGDALAGPGVRRVVVGTDFSADGDQAVDRTTQLELAPEAVIFLVHVLPAQFERSLDSLIRFEAERMLGEVAERIGERLVAAGRADVRVTVRLARGTAWEEIARTADHNGADLVLVGRRGHTLLHELLLGSTASNMLRHGQRPVLVATRAAPGGYRCVLLAYDRSPVAFAAAQVARRMLPARVTVCAARAYELPWRGVPSSMLGGMTTAQLDVPPGALEQEAEAAQSALEPLWPDGDLRVVVEEDDPRRLVLQAAAESGADLIVLGSRGLSGVARVALGSVAESVLQRATVDVLVVPAAAAPSAEPPLEPASALPTLAH